MSVHRAAVQALGVALDAVQQALHSAPGCPSATIRAGARLPPGRERPVLQSGSRIAVVAPAGIFDPARLGNERTD